MDKPLESGYRVSIYKNTSWGGWFTAGEYRTLASAESRRAQLSAKGYETSIAKF